MLTDQLFSSQQPSPWGVDYLVSAPDETSGTLEIDFQLTFTRRLVATTGPKSKTAKISRKAIQEVNVQKACETIIEPGAPIALRLQSSLLYGVSRVFSQQCNYVLSDAEKVQTRIRAFYGALNVMGNTLDPAAGKTR